MSSPDQAIPQDLLDKAEMRQVEVFITQGRKLFTELLLVPACVECELIIGEGERAALDVGQGPNTITGTSVRPSARAA